MSEIQHCQCVELLNEFFKKAYKIDISKALNPLDKDDFLIISTRLAKSLSKISREEEKKAIGKSLKKLDVDWAGLTSKGRTKIINEISKYISDTPNVFIPEIIRELKVRGERIVRGTRSAVRRQVEASVRSKIGASMSLKDRRIIDHSANSHSFFVTDEYGRRSENFSTKARNIVSRGLEDGLGSDEIADELRAQIGNELGPRRSGRYWNVVASAFVNRSRTYGHLASFEEAGIERYRFEAVLDERTTPECAFLHGKEFIVSSSLQRYEQVAQSSDPEAVKDIMPMMRRGRDSDGLEFMYIERRDGTRTRIADVVTPRAGRDSIGSYNQRVNDQQLSQLGVDMPPLHFACRSTIVASL